MGKILARGHSRVPVYSGNPKNIIGLLLVFLKIKMLTISLFFITRFLDLSTVSLSLSGEKPSHG